MAMGCRVQANPSDVNYYYFGASGRTYQVRVLNFPDLAATVTAERLKRARVLDDLIVEFGPASGRREIIPTIEFRQAKEASAMIEDQLLAAYELKP